MNQLDMAHFVQQFPSEYESQAEFESFLTDYPAYLGTSCLSTRRCTDFGHIDAAGETYLDFTASGLYGQPQLEAHFAWLQGSLLGNPHSVSPASERATVAVATARQAVLDFFRADPEEYCVVFTANASAAIQRVAEAYPFGPSRPLMVLVDNHNSVLGMREFARAKRADVLMPLVRRPDLHVDREDLSRYLNSAKVAGGLFAMPAQSNFSGVQHDLDWVTQAQNRGMNVLLDAAAFVPTNRLDLSLVRPDFVCLSFYKMFGWPTGVGCLLARHEALAALERPAFAGGTVEFATAQGNGYRLAAGNAGFEDGTVDFLNLQAITIGLEYLAEPGMEAIHDRVACLTGWALDELVDLVHTNGRPVVRVYGPASTENRGGTIAFNLLTPQGHLVDERYAEGLAKEAGISLRTGCFCNPGAGEVGFGLSPVHLQAAALRMRRSSVTKDDLLYWLGMENGGAIRASFGAVSTFRDAERLVRLVQCFRDGPPPMAGLPDRNHC
jgi:molybdenum cofactor sulfurtransferase